jgi:hypothetical protein
MDDVRELIKQQERVTQLEDRVKAWMKKVQEVHLYFGTELLYLVYLVLTFFLLCMFCVDILFCLVWNYSVFEKVSE